MPDERDTLQGMVEHLARLQARQHPGRPTFTALARAMSAVEDAARELAHARAAHGRAAE